LRMVVGGAVTPCVDARILVDYEQVLARPRFGFAPDAVDALIGFIATEGEHVVAAPWRETLPDPDDAPFLEVAVAGGAACLVTGNLAHFPVDARGGVAVRTPAAFVASMREGPPPR
ncbi:MAG: PIN domain-containing protein, partial [Trueperaceae bacterium]|nr:PIN domain-containing protein [Trueperaceae bacterium]